MFRKMLEEALGELMQEMAPQRPQIDPPDQRRRPDMAQGPDEEGKRVSVGSPRPQPTPVFEPATSVRPQRPTSVGDQEGRRAPRESAPAEGRRAPRESWMDEGRAAPREASILEGPRAFREAIGQRAIQPAMPAVVSRRHPAHPMRRYLSSPESVRNAFRLMEILGPPVSLRGESDRLGK
jgi:hypothetical protein